MYKLIQGKHLSIDESYQIFSQLSSMLPEKQSALLALLQAKKESMEEIIGAYQYFKQYQKKITHNFDVIDIVGTGGDGGKSFNISTIASIIIASTGVYVAKHGGSAASSQSGSFDMVSFLGIKAASNSKACYDNLKAYRYAYLCAPMFNKALNEFGFLRKRMGIPTMFNILGPLLNPALPKRCVIGVYRDDLRQKMARIMLHQGVTHALVIHGQEGLDEMSISGPTSVSEIKNGIISDYQVKPEDVGLNQASISTIEVESIEESKEVFVGVLSGEITDAKRDVVLLNAAAGLYVAGKVKMLAQGVLMAKNAIDNGDAFALYKKLGGSNE